MKKYILTGLIIVLPIAITVWIARFFFDLLTTPFMGLIQFSLDSFGYISALHPFLVFFCRIIILLILVALIYVIGFIAHRIVFSWILKLTHKLFSKIPIVKSIYKISREVIKSLFSPGAKPFKKTVIMDFPDKDSRALGFYTGDVPEDIIEPKASQKEDKLQTVFLPTAPHPISGFLLISPESKLKDVDISVEEVFKILVSCGTYRPGEAPPQPSEKEKNQNANTD